MQSISPEIIFRGNYAWEKSLSRISKLTRSPLILGRGVNTSNLRNKIFIDLKNQNLNVNSSDLQFDCCYEDISKVKNIILKEVFARLQDKGIKLDVTDAFKERLVEEGYNPSYGARPLRRAVMRLLEDSLAEEVLSGRIKDGDMALVDIDENKKVTINISSEESPQELASANF